VGGEERLWGFGGIGGILERVLDSGPMDKAGSGRGGEGPVNLMKGEGKLSKKGCS